MKSYFGPLCLMAVCLPAYRRAASDPQLRLLSSSVTPYGKVEFDIAIDTQYARPFDPREVHLSILLETPGGRAVRVPAKSFSRRTCHWSSRHYVSHRHPGNAMSPARSRQRRRPVDTVCRLPSR